MTTYKIKPLKWTKDKLIEAYDSIHASTSFGNYSIILHEDGSYRWYYCFDEYYDEDDFECDSIKEGKIKAQEHWIERISGALKKVK